MSEPKKNSRKPTIIALCIVFAVLIGFFCVCVVRIIDCPNCVNGIVHNTFGLPIENKLCYECDLTGELTIAQWMQNSFFNG